MTRTVQVQVTADDIGEGRPMQRCACPVALAVRRAVPEADYAGVSRSQLRVRIGRKTHHFDLPLEAVNFIASFDAWQPVEPFAFTLPILDTEAA